MINVFVALITSGQTTSETPVSVGGVNQPLSDAAVIASKRMSVYKHHLSFKSRTYDKIQLPSF
jgi:hypothetical protein